jgi:ectoine hydroxylase-related dioxygenase (phytanoyl-CoA dioxygenase family)
MGADRAWLYYDQIFLKDGESFRTEWHQDMAYYEMRKGAQVGGAWISLDPLTKEYSLELVRGSHRGPLYDGGSMKTKLAALWQLGYGPIPNIEANRKDYDIVSFDFEPGDLLILDKHILHGGAPMRAGQTRRALTINIFGPDVQWQPRPPGHTPSFPGLDKVMTEGEPLWHGAEKGFFHQLRPVPAKRLGVMPEHDMFHGPEGGLV